MLLKDNLDAKILFKNIMLRKITIGLLIGILGGIAALLIPHRLRFEIFFVPSIVSIFAQMYWDIFLFNVNVLLIIYMSIISILVVLFYKSRMFYFVTLLLHLIVYLYFLGPVLFYMIMN